MGTWTRIALVVVLAWLASGCPDRDDAMDVWARILSRCTGDETLDRKRMVYLGPSNPVGPGSLWRRTNGGGVHLRRLLGDLTTASTEEAVLEGAASTCSGAVELDAKTLARLLGSFGNSVASVRAQADVARQMTVVASVDAWAKDVLVEGRFEDLYHRTQAQNAFRNDATQDGRYLMTKAIRVIGFQFSIDHDAAMALGLDVKGSPHEVIDAGGVEFQVERDRAGRLTLRTTEAFYVSGELLPVTEVLVDTSGPEPAINAPRPFEFVRPTPAMYEIPAM